MSFPHVTNTLNFKMIENNANVEPILKTILIISHNGESPGREPHFLHVLGCVFVSFNTAVAWGGAAGGLGPSKKFDRHV